MGRTVIVCPTRLVISLLLALALLQLCNKPGQGIKISPYFPLPAGLILLDQILNFTCCVAVLTPMPHKKKEQANYVQGGKQLSPSLFW